jgi:hypothetical protein
VNERIAGKTQQSMLDLRKLTNKLDPDAKPSLNTQPRPMLPPVGHPERVSKVNALPDVRSCSVKMPLRLTICLIV